MAFIPNTTEELYIQLCKTEGLRGDISLTEEGSIVWNLNKNLTRDVFLDETDRYIGINKGLHHHWHPQAEDIYTELCELGKAGNVLVVRESIIGTQLFYCGPAEEYRFSPKTKWYWGRLYYLG
ncbi:MAG: hypothetical protein GX802_05205 [Clostridiales bacterium]|jgi:hypothetical protein|nr:hypothetical protein [Clostridiales bacterium]